MCIRDRPGKERPLLTECIQETFRFAPHFSRQVEAGFTAGQVSSDGGALLLREADRKINLLGRLAACFSDGRAPLLVKHQLPEMLGQRIYALPQHLRQLVLDQQRSAPVAKASCQPPQQVDLAIRLAQQQRPAVARHLPGGKPGFHLTRKMWCKAERFLDTLCQQRPLLPRHSNYDSTTQLCLKTAAFCYLFLLAPVTPRLHPVRNAG